MAERTFTLEEAQTLIPVLESLLRSAMEGKKLIQEAELNAALLSASAGLLFLDEIHLLRATHQHALLQVLDKRRIFLSGGSNVDVLRLARRKAERDKAAQTVKDSLAEINATGVQVKDLDIGLLDFPCLIEDQIILLCWKLGENKITHWHGLTEGFRGRKPIDDRIRKQKKEDRPH